jgi:hypothetical protein
VDDVMRRQIATLVAVGMLMAASSGLAQDRPDGSLLAGKTSHAVGLTKSDFLAGESWRGWVDAQEFGRTDEFTVSRDPDDDGSGGDTGRRIKAGAMSLIVPGAGQFYNGDRSKALIMVGVEAAVWGAYLGFDRHADNLSDDYRSWAGVYAGTAGEHPDSYWQAVGRYADSDAWYESRLREARAFGDPAPAAPGDDETWQWRNEGFRRSYQELRADANEAYDRRDLMILFAIINRAVSVFDAVRNGGEREPDAPALGARILGADVALEVSAPLPSPQARASACWSF